jgi:hypothetical protein
MVNTAMTASTINVTKGVANNILALGNLNKATTTVAAGTLKSQMSLTAATVAAGGSGMTITGPGAAVQTYTLDTKADNVTLTGDLGAVIHVINGGTTASAATSDTFSARINSTSTDLTNVTGFEVLNLTLKDATATGFDDGTKDNGFENASVVNILGGNSNSSFTMSATSLLTRDKSSAALAQSIDASTTSAPMTLLFGSDDLDIQTTVKGGSATTDNVSTIIAAGASTTVGNNPTMSGIELLTVTSTDGDADAVINLSNVTGLGRVDATFATDTGSSVDQIEIDGLAAGVPLRVAGTNAGDNLDVGLASASGTADALSITSTANNVGLNLDAAGIESLTLAQNVNASYDLAGVSPTTGAATTVTLAGSGNVALTAIHTGINVIDGSAMGGTLTVQAGARDADIYTITGGVNNDVIAMENGGDILTGGAQPAGGGDTLEVTLSAILGGITVDLSATDQVVTMDGGTNAAVQSGFESVDVSGFSGFGSVITGSDGANTITGTILADRINAGKGVDTIKVTLTNDANNDQINGGAGADTLEITDDYTPAGDANLVAVETITSASTGTINVSNQTEALAITGGANNQTIIGNAASVDTMTGGAGNDVFQFITSAAGASASVANAITAYGGAVIADVIVDMVVANDQITLDLSAFAFSGTTNGNTLVAADFTSVANATTAVNVNHGSGGIVYDQGAKAIHYVVKDMRTATAGGAQDTIAELTEGTDYVTLATIGTLTGTLARGDFDVVT